MQVLIAACLSSLLSSSPTPPLEGNKYFSNQPETLEKPHIFLLKVSLLTILFSPLSSPPGQRRGRMEPAPEFQSNSPKCEHRGQKLPMLKKIIIKNPKSAAWADSATLKSLPVGETCGKMDHLGWNTKTTLKIASNILKNCSMRWGSTEPVGEGLQKASCGGLLARNQRNPSQGGAWLGLGKDYMCSTRE